MANPLITIDIVSDVVCPWCIIGYKQLLKAISELSSETGNSIDTAITWHPFELNPDMPQGGENLRSHLAQKYGTTLEGSIAARKRLTELGESLGFTFSYFDDMRMYNTRKAHKLLHWAKDQKVNGEPVQTDLKMAMFSSFFTYKGVIDDEETLLSLADSVGLDKELAKTVLDDREIDEQVKQSQNQWRRQGIQAVPAFIFNERYLVSGAQDADFFKEMLVKLSNEEASQEALA